LVKANWVALHDRKIGNSTLSWTFPHPVGLTTI
jgi:hypothetical protein